MILWREFNNSNMSWTRIQSQHSKCILLHLSPLTSQIVLWRVSWCFHGILHNQFIWWSLYSEYSKSVYLWEHQEEYSECSTQYLGVRHHQKFKSLFTIPSQCFLAEYFIIFPVYDNTIMKSKPSKGNITVNKAFKDLPHSLWLQLIVMYLSPALKEPPCDHPVSGQEMIDIILQVALKIKDFRKKTWWLSSFPSWINMSRPQTDIHTPNMYLFIFSKKSGEVWWDQPQEGVHGPCPRTQYRTYYQKTLSQKRGYMFHLLRSGYPLPPDRGPRYSESPHLWSLPEGRGLSVPASCHRQCGCLYPSPSAG